MRRREFISLLGGVATAWPFMAHAEQVAARPVVGFLTPIYPVTHLVAAFRQGLNEMGFVEGQNITIEYRFAEGRYDRLTELAADLVQRRVAVLLGVGNTYAARAAKAASTTIPVVFAVGDDPVKFGLVASLDRPGGNATGVNFFASEVGAKSLGLLRDLLPAATRVGVLINPNNVVGIETWMRDVRVAASATGVQIDLVKAQDGREIENAFQTLVHNKADALLAGPDSLFYLRRVQLATLATRYAIPTIYWFREFADAGGLLSYGAGLADAYHQVGVYTGRILKGAKPADLPVVQSTKFELVLNLNTARALGLTIPASLLAIADEVIE